MIHLTSLIALIEALMVSLLIMYLGNLLINPEQLRSFLGLKTESEDISSHSITSAWVKKAGKLLILIGMLKAIAAIVTTVLILMNS
jgi:hypothetical protein